MLIALSSPMEVTLVVVGLVVFALASWRKIDLAATLIILLTPLYLFKIVILGLPLTLLELLILVLALVWLIKRARLVEAKAKRVINKSGHPWKALDKNLLWPAGLIIIGTFLATAWSVDWKISAGIFKSWILEPMLLAFIVWDIIKTKEQFKKILLAAVASGVIVAILSLIYWLAGELTFDGRLKGFYLSPNHLAMYLAPSFVLLAGLFVLSKNKREKIILGILGLAVMAALYLTYSYAAWLAILAALIFLVLVWWPARFAEAPARLAEDGESRRARRDRNKKRWLAVILLLMIVLVISQWPSVKLHNLLGSDRSSWQSRLMVWRASVTILKDHWLIGIGPGLFQRYYLASQQYFPVPYLEWAVPQPHNLWLAWWLQGGLMGLVGFLWLTAVFFWQIAKNFKKTKPPFVPSGGTSEGGQALILILAAVMVCILVHGLVDTPYWKNDLALVFWLLIALSDKAGRFSC